MCDTTSFFFKYQRNCFLQILTICFQNILYKHFFLIITKLTKLEVSLNLRIVAVFNDIQLFVHRKDLIKHERLLINNILTKIMCNEFIFMIFITYFKLFLFYLLRFYHTITIRVNLLQKQRSVKNRLFVNFNFL